jgi:hypothetical protein
MLGYLTLALRPWAVEVVAPALKAGLPPILAGRVAGYLRYIGRTCLSAYVVPARTKLSLAFRIGRAGKKKLGTKQRKNEFLHYRYPQ